MIWVLRYRKPQGVAIVRIHTVKDHESDAIALGKKHVNAQPGPAYRFISVERDVVASDAPDKLSIENAGAAEPGDDIANEMLADILKRLKVLEANQQQANAAKSAKVPPAAVTGGQRGGKTHQLRGGRVGA